MFVLFFYDRVASDRMVRSWLIYLASSFGAAKNSPRFGGFLGKGGIRIWAETFARVMLVDRDLTWHL